jgi:hypothetical protein
MRNSELLELGSRKLMTLFLIGLLFWPVASRSQSGSHETTGKLSASLDQDSASVGSVVVLTLSYRLPEGGHLPEEPEIKGLEDLTILGRTMERGRIKIKLLVDRLSPWKSGPLSLAYKSKEGKRETLKTEPVSLTVISNLGEKPEEARLRPIQGIIPMRALWLKYLPWVAGLLGLLLAVAGFLWWLKRRRAHQETLESMEPPHIRARKEIGQLEARGLFEKGHIKEFYFGISEILRRYLEALRRFPAAEFTTEEIALHMDREQDRKLLPLLRQADLVKFADTIPTTGRKEEDLKAAIFYIQETSPAPEEGRSATLSPHDQAPVAGARTRRKGVSQ